MAVSAIQKNHIYSTYFAPRGRMRIYNLGIQIAQLYLSPFDKLIGVIGESGSGKSVLIKGMFPEPADRRGRGDHHHPPHPLWPRAAGGLSACV